MTSRLTIKVIMSLGYPISIKLSIIYICNKNKQKKFFSKMIIKAEVKFVFFIGYDKKNQKRAFR